MGYFADEEIAEPAVAQDAPLEYDNENEGGGGGMSEPLSERMAKLEAGLEALQKSASGIKAIIIVTAIAVLGLAIAIIIGFANMQGNNFQSLINANQQTAEARMEEFRKVSEAQMKEFLKVSEARAEEFRRDSARNYDLALKALERAMVQPQPSPVPPPQAPPVQTQTPQAQTPQAQPPE